MAQLGKLALLIEECPFAARLSLKIGRLSIRGGCSTEVAELGLDDVDSLLGEKSFKDFKDF